MIKILKGKLLEFDVNHDGKIDHNEMKAIFSYLGITQSDEDIEQILLTCDPKNLGFVEINDLIERIISLRE